MTSLAHHTSQRASGSTCEPAARCGWRFVCFLEMKENFSMRRFCAPALALLVATAGLMAAELKSGLEVGDACGAFNVKDITGPSKDKTLCYR
jgi:hypothetical protein